MWKDAYLENRVLSADPIELVHMLYEHAIHQVQDARHSLVLGNIAARSKAISRTVAILVELESSLDHERGGALSRNLAGLYEYMRLRLTTANVKQEDGPLAEVEKLLKTMDEGWSAIRPAVRGQQNGRASEAADEAPAGPWCHFAKEPELELAGHNWSA